MKEINFGIIIPIYNVKEYLQECLDSVIYQTYKHMQIVLVDDGSFDGSSEIAYQYFQKDSRVTLIQKPNGGLSQARNVGMDYLMSSMPKDCKVYAHSDPFIPDYIHFLDSDDYLEPHCIEKCVDFLSAHREIDCLWHDYYLFYQEKAEYSYLSCLPFKKEAPSILLVEEMFQSMTTQHLNFAWHGVIRSGLLKNLRFVEGIEYEDVAFAFMLFSRSVKIGILRKQLLCYRIRKGSITNPHKVSYPSYMKDLEGKFLSFWDAKFYNLFYSDCINILRAHQDLQEQKLEGGLELELKKRLRWRVFHFLVPYCYKIKKNNDPRYCLDLYHQIRQYGYAPILPPIFYTIKSFLIVRTQTVWVFIKCLIYKLFSLRRLGIK